MKDFIPFKAPFTKMENLIRKPLFDLSEGYIYGFKVKDVPYTKIGRAGPRDNEPSLEASLEARMKEHRDDGWAELSVVLRMQVPNAQRVEKLIHYHLETGRMRWKGQGKGAKTEWFNNSLDEIRNVAEAWQCWMRSSPYEDPHGETEFGHLNSKWRGNLDRLQIRNGRDNWLYWLHRYVPEIPRLAHNDKWIDDESTAKRDRSFGRNNASGNSVEIIKTRTNLL
jgi:hypothetical protein